MQPFAQSKMRAKAWLLSFQVFPKLYMSCPMSCPSGAKPKLIVNHQSAVPLIGIRGIQAAASIKSIVCHKSLTHHDELISLAHSHSQGAALAPSKT